MNNIRAIRRKYRTPARALEAWFAASTTQAVHEWLGCTAEEWNEFQDPVAYAKAQAELKKAQKLRAGVVQRKPPPPDVFPQRRKPPARKRRAR